MTVRQVIFTLLSLKPPADDPGRHTSDLCKFWYVSRYNRARAYNSSATDRYSRQNDSVCADIGPGADMDGGDLQVRLNEWDICRQTCVLGTQPT